MKHMGKIDSHQATTYCNKLQMIVTMCLVFEIFPLGRMFLEDWLSFANCSAKCTTLQASGRSSNQWELNKMSPGGCGRWLKLVLKSRISMLDIILMVTYIKAALWHCCRYRRQIWERLDILPHVLNVSALVAIEASLAILSSDAWSSTNSYRYICACVLPFYQRLTTTTPLQRYFMSPGSVAY